jgi:hypothetical protein
VGETMGRKIGVLAAQNFLVLRTQLK